MRFACDFFEFVDPEYTARSMEVIDQMVEEQIESRNWMFGDHNECFWAHEADMKIEDGLRLEIGKLKNMLFITLGVIAVLIELTGSTMFAWRKCDV